MEGYDAKKKLTSGEIILVVIALPLPFLCLQMISLILFTPVFLVLFTLIAMALFAVLVLVGGITMFGIGISKIFTMPMGALSIAGFGLANIGIALLTECFVLCFFTVVLPKGVRKICGNKEVKNEKAA